MMRLFFYIFCWMTISSCGGICGELTGQWKKMYEEAQEKFAAKFKVERVNCEFFYLNVYCRSPNIDTTALQLLHNAVFDSTQKIGWRVLLVHDINGNYVFSHNPQGLIYVQTGD